MTTIKHLVITGGGGHAVIKCMAVYQKLISESFIKLSEIETIWGTSAGSIVATLIALKYDWKMINTYIIERPWNKLFNITLDRLFDLYHKKGIFDVEIIEKSFKPIFDVIDIPLDITLEDFHKFSKIEIHFSTFEINSFELCDISYKTHPNLRLLLAIQMSCGLPIIFTPVCLDNKIFIDGGIKTSYSLDSCIEYGCNPNEILGLRNKLHDENTLAGDDTNLFDYMLHLLVKIINSVRSISSNKIKHEIELPPLLINLNILKECSENQELRQQLFDEGIEIATNYLSTVCKN